MDIFKILNKVDKQKIINKLTSKIVRNKYIQKPCVSMYICIKNHMTTIFENVQYDIILQTLCISRACMDNNFEWSLLNATKPQ